MSLQVTIADVAASGTAVTGHGEDLAAKHASTTARIDAAQAGWQGSSATVIEALTERWTATTSALLTQLSDHAQALHASANGFAEMEQRHTYALEQLHTTR